MGVPYITIEDNQGKPVVVSVFYNGKRKQSFPLTKRGCLLMGRYLFSAKIVHWIGSSSIDHPQESKRWFTHDVRALIGKGYSDAVYESEADDRSLTDKILAYCKLPGFQQLLTAAERKAFAKLMTTVARSRAEARG